MSVLMNGWDMMKALFLKISGALRRILIPSVEESLTVAEVISETALMNVRRIYSAVLFAIPLDILHISLFWFTAAHDSNIQTTWRNGILASHFGLLSALVVLAIVSSRLRTKTVASRSVHCLQYAAFAVAMAAAVTIVAVDQLVTSNITPFLTGCIICGGLFIIRPLYALIIYTISYLAYYLAIAFTGESINVLLSNRVNGITAVGLAFGLSVMLWRNNYVTITQRRRIANQQRMLERMAYHDDLTTLHNRRWFDRIVQCELDKLDEQDQDQDSVLVVMDIDHFKLINDTYGHPTGDEVLCQLALILMASRRENDIVARLGGEEFIILLAQTQLETGRLLAERLRKRVMEAAFVVGTVTLHITASFGVASLRAVKERNLPNYYALADEAMYQAKQNGRNRVEAAD